MRSTSVGMTPDNASAIASEGNDELTGVAGGMTPDDALAVASEGIASGDDALVTASGGAHQMMHRQFHQGGSHQLIHW